MLFLPSIATRGSPLPIRPLPLSSSPFHLDEKILILMALRLFFLFFSFLFFFLATQQWCDGLSYMPHGCSLLIGGLSRHICTRTCTRSCTHTHTHGHRRPRAGFRLVSFPSVALPTPTSTMAPFHPSSYGQCSNVIHVSSPHCSLLSPRHYSFPKAVVCRSSWD